MLARKASTVSGPGPFEQPGHVGRGVAEKPLPVAPAPKLCHSSRAERGVDQLPTIGFLVRQVPRRAWSPVRRRCPRIAGALIRVRRRIVDRDEERLNHGMLGFQRVDDGDLVRESDHVRAQHRPQRVVFDLVVGDQERLELHPPQRGPLVVCHHRDPSVQRSAPPAQGPGARRRGSPAWCCQSSLEAIVSSSEVLEYC